MAQNDDWWNNVPGPVKYLILGALVAGGTSNFVGLSQDTSDRYHAQTAEKDFAQRDARIRELEREFHRHLEHSARYTEVIERTREYARQIDKELEEHLEDKH